MPDMRFAERTDDVKSDVKNTVIESFDIG